MSKEQSSPNKTTNNTSSSSSKYISSKYNYISKIRNMFNKIIEKNNTNNITKSLLLNLDNFSPKTLFDEIDSNKKGFINSIDLLKYFNNKYNEQIIRKLIQHYDKHSHYKLIYDDFKSIFNNNSNHYNNVKENSEKLNDKYDLFNKLIKGEVELILIIDEMIEDIKKCENFITYEAFIYISNNEKNIDKNKMKKFLEEKYDENEINFLIYYLDMNNDGLISYDEFEDFFATLNQNEVNNYIDMNEFNNIVNNNEIIEKKNPIEKDNLNNLTLKYMNYEKKILIENKVIKKNENKIEQKKIFDDKNIFENEKIIEDKKMNKNEKIIENKKIIENEIDNNNNYNNAKYENKYKDMNYYDNDNDIKQNEDDNNIHNNDKYEKYEVTNIIYDVREGFNNNIIEYNKIRNKDTNDQNININDYDNNKNNNNNTKKENTDYLDKYKINKIEENKINKKINNTNNNLRTYLYNNNIDINNNKPNNSNNSNEIIKNTKDDNKNIEEKENKEDNYLSFLQRNINNKDYKYNDSNLNKRNNDNNPINQNQLKNNTEKEKIINIKNTSKNNSNDYNNSNDDYIYSHSNNEIEEFNEQIINEDEYDNNQNYENNLNNNNNEYNNVMSSNNFSNNLTSTDFNKSDNFINENNIQSSSKKNYKINNNTINYNSKRYDIKIDKNQYDENTNNNNVKSDFIVETNTNIEIKRDIYNNIDKNDNKNDYNNNLVYLKEKYMNTNTNNNSNNGNSRAHSIKINGSLFTCGGNVSVKTNNENQDIDEYNLKNNNNLLYQKNNKEISEFKYNNLNEGFKNDISNDIENQIDYFNNNNKYDINNNYYFNNNEKNNLREINKYTNTKYDYNENIYQNNIVNNNQNENEIKKIKNNLCENKYNYNEKENDEEILTNKFLQEKYKYNNNKIGLKINKNLNEKDKDNNSSSSNNDDYNNKTIKSLNNNSLNLFLDYIDIILKNENKCYTLKESLSLREDITFKELFCLFDYHQNKNISIHEFKKVCKNILSLYPTNDQIKLIFYRYDINKDEKLDLKEFLNMICPIKKEYLGILFGDKKVHKSFHSELSDKSKKLIINLVKSIILNESNYYEIREKMKLDNFSVKETWNVLLEFSKNKNCLNLTEFGKFLRNYSVNLTQYEIEIIFHKFDFDKDELINFEDFNHEFIM